MRTAAQDWLRALQSVADIERDPSRTLSDRFDDIAATQADTPALISEDETFSYRQLVDRSNRYARWAIKNNLGKGDVVALMMGNRAEYVAIWLGLNRVGVAVALLNTGLTGEALGHCIRICNAAVVIVSAPLYPACIGALEKSKPIDLVVHGAEENVRRVDLEVDQMSGEPLCAGERAQTGLSDHALYIYTSGTTGMPKAAIVTHRRVLNWALWFRGLAGVSASDRMYNCLPLFHSVGGVVAIWPALLAGGSVVIRRRFSASLFWDEVVALDCTLFQYIGELCRYLLASPPGDAERRHRLRLCVGNGLGADIWTRFQERFSIPRILEFYAATESNFSLYNVEGEPGAIGRIPPFLAQGFQIAIVRFDFEREEPVREIGGHCVRCEADEVGEVIAKIEQKSGNEERNFEGYLNRVDLEKKVLRNVFSNGDAWMRSGDLMRKDTRGFYYFVDRIGDTFRWKGENASTLEVAQAISACPGVTEANVYGVSVPGREGRAGMAALAVDANFDLAALRKHIELQLPDYARPLFVRFSSRIETTDTFKHKKRALVAESFNPKNTSDAVYFLQPGEDSYVRLDDNLYEAIVSGQVRV